jgi:two-component system sensor histidine kinase MprB
MSWLRGLQLRTRVALVASLAVALAVVVVAGSAYVLTRNELLGQLDESLEARVSSFRGSLIDAISARGGQGRIPGGPGEFDALYVQLVAATGESLAPPQRELNLPIEPIDISVAAREVEPQFRTVEVDGVRLRLYTAPISFGGGRGFGQNRDNLAVQIGRSMGEVESSLSQLGWALFLGGGIGILAAAGIGLVVARSALRPLETLTSAAETVASTQELDARIDVVSDDEVGRLASAFNDMLAALNQSKVQQRQLVRDASHELRTPLTALRTNIELLARSHAMGDVDRRELLDDVTVEVEELSALVGELVDLATDTDVDEVPTTVELADVAEVVAERYRRRTSRTITLSGDAEPLVAKRGAIDRAIRNLVDNAVKWSDQTEPIVIQVSDTADEARLVVADRGPGIPVDDRESIFERFYRTDEARGLPGSGLGLAIVARIVEDHGGATFAEDNPGGGAVVGFTLPRQSRFDGGQGG